MRTATDILALMRTRVVEKVLSLTQKEEILLNIWGNTLALIKLEKLQISVLISVQ